MCPEKHACISQTLSNLITTKELFAIFSIAVNLQIGQIGLIWPFSCLIITAKEQKGYKFGEMDEEEKARICFNFTVGDPERREFYSPLFNLSGGTYPNNTECMKRITGNLEHLFTFTIL